MDELQRVRPEVMDFEPYSPGLAIDEIRERYGLEQVIKMASNENPLGTSPLVQKVIETAAPMAFRYAQAGTPRLHAAIAQYLDVPAECVVAGNGSDEIIDLLIRVKARPGVDNIIAFSPCFSMYELQARLCGVEFRQTPLNRDFTFPWDDLAALADDKTALCFVTSPDNPSGFSPPAADLEALARRLPKSCLLVIDEAYMDFAQPQEAYSLLSRREEFPNVVFLRTFSKMFGMAGLRLGYGIMPPWLADKLMRVKLPFSVNILAEEAGIAALKDQDFIQATLKTVNQGRQAMIMDLARINCRVYPSMANFLLFDLPPGCKVKASEFFERLLEKGIIIRPLASYGLDNSMRVSIGNEDENRAFTQAATEILGYD